MIRVRKPELAPQILRERGTALTAELCRSAEAGAAPSFDRDVYGAAEVKQALRAAQHDKCCFCESKLEHSQFGDVEHFRPKAQAHQGPDVPRSPGYYWLAYDWRNLYLSCEVCNRRHKRGLFPLADPAHRVPSHHRASDTAAEQPLFVDPGFEDPETFIEFRREYAAPVHGNARGIATLEALQLNRSALLQRRREHRQPLLALVGLLRSALRHGLAGDDGTVSEALDSLSNATLDSGAYAAMARSIVDDLVPERPRGAVSATALLAALQADAATPREPTPTS